MAKSLERPRVGGGGAATSAGILFEQKLGALFGAWMLAGRRLDPRFTLGDTTAAWIRFETEAPVDDILIATSAGGFIAVQAKTTASLSPDLRSPFGKTVTQFVRHWLACRDGNGKQHWNRPLNPDLDRLVLAIGPGSPAGLREDLAAALRLRAQPGRGALTIAQQRAYDLFAGCVEQAWAAATVEAYDPELPEHLASLITIFVFDPNDVGRRAVLDSLEDALDVGADPGTALTALESVSGELMAARGGADRPTLRQALLSQGVALSAPPNYERDIAALRAHSDAVADSLRRYEVIEATYGNAISVDRECQPAIEAAAREGSLLIVGEPGAGKSGVLNALARNLREAGNDVLELAVDRHSVETLEGLSRELKLHHGILDVLDAWDGAQPGWLVIDALDATRGGKGEGVFRSLIEQVLERKGRWRVIASIRTFDLRMGQQFRSLFKGTPPVEGLQEPGLASVRHVKVPAWSQTEFARLLDAAPALAKALAPAPEALRDLAIVPFNTRLLSDLIKEGLVSTDFSHIGSQAQLLQLYWSYRVERRGARGRACITRIATAMVDARALRAPVATAASSDPEMIDLLASEGVIIVVDNGRWVQFRHHLLFDFAAARMLIDPEKLVDGTLRFAKEQGRGLMLAPALSFVLREIWERELDRTDFWSAAAIILADQDSDPVIRSATGRICAEYPKAVGDLTILADRVVAGDAKAAKAFMHAVGAFAIRLEDHPDAELTPWVNLLRDLSANVSPVASTVRFLLFKLVTIVLDDAGRAYLGKAARALFDYAAGLEGDRNMMASAIDLVADTFATNPSKSRQLLVKIFEPQRLASRGWDEVPALCRKIRSIAAVDADFAALIYRETYGFDVTESHETRMGDSQILSLTSNAGQDYDMARYALGEFVPTFLADHPNAAVAAIVFACDAFVARKHPPSPDLKDVRFEIDGRAIRLREDRSHIWAHDPDSTYGHEGESLVRKLLDYLRAVDGGAAAQLVDRIIDTASLAIFWSRMFMAAAERDDVLVDRLLPFAMAQPFLMSADTRKDAIDLIAKGYARLPHASRVAFERSVETFNFSKYASPETARQSFLRRLFSAVGATDLATEAARSVLPNAVDQLAADDVANERPFAVRTYSHAPAPFHWIEDLKHDSPVERSLMEAIATTKEVLGLDGATHDGSTLSLEQILAALVALSEAIDRQHHHEGLVVYAEGVIAEGLGRIMSRTLAPRVEDVPATEQTLSLLAMVADSEGPTLDADTERNFEQGPSWSSPAPRVEGGAALLDLTLQRPDLYPLLERSIDQLLADPHPAVRLQTGLRLVRIWDRDREGFWRRLAGRLGQETNLSVIEHLTKGVLSRVLHADPVRMELLALALLDRFPENPKRQARLREALAGEFTVLWIRYGCEASYGITQRWIGDVVYHHPELIHVLATMRGAFVAGLTAEPKVYDHELRQRALNLALQIVEAASEGLRAHFELGGSTPEQLEAARNHAQLLDAACRELYFATGAGHDSSQSSRPIDDVRLGVFFAEAAPILHRIGDWATPHTIYYLLQLLEFLLPVDPRRSFDLMEHALRSGGRHSGYQFESLGADLLVRLVGVFLADHKELFEDEQRRVALIDCLEIFMDAGWPAARRLLYRLPELIQ
ncbi:hypothetical protein IP69_20145 [Bosea sp. AAP35]|uniref:ATP-binding protein n=1 Tax=Bosea sp. AAP35 TaxID=1523417 RepID=UPI0006B8D55B|nr:ATP-binding protein [Bosea sp. AAP35]KPF62768.1 hypothetical protein IP69_20145 [Bosea sp. AAP35]